ncbi:MAG: glycosyltransferase [Polyangiales bacterium]
MADVDEVHLRAATLERFAPLAGEAAVREVMAAAERFVAHTRDRVVWNVSSTAVGGGVAEMLHTFLAYARGIGVDVRWVVIKGSPDFFRITKRLHNALHGSLGDGSPLGDEQRATYEAIQHRNVQEMLALVRPNDVVILHDPQTAGLAPQLRAAGMKVIWRCHIGSDSHDEVTAAGWSFLQPYVSLAHVCVFSRVAYLPPTIPRSRTVIIVPAIDPLTPKNQELAPEVVKAIMAHTGLVAGDPNAPTSFTRWDGSPGRVDRAADMIRLGPPPPPEAPLIVQVSRWDQLKDPIGVMQGFARMLARSPTDAQLVLAGPNVNAVADDPDGARIFGELVETFRALPHHIRRLVHLASLPTDDLEENAAIVNALQRHATVVVQKSLHEGFGLTVTEGMWKSRAVVASAVGGIVDQIEDGESGILLRDPRDLDAFAASLKRLLDDPELRARLGANAHERVRERFLATRSLTEYARVIERIDAEVATERAA